MALRIACILTACTTNSLSNLEVAEALIAQGLTDPVDVRLGSDTFDEMCLALIGVVSPL